MAKSKKLTDAQRLTVPCVKCGAVAGEMCHDKNVVAPTDRAKFCVERGRPEVTRKKLQKRADFINSRTGPEAQFPGLLALTGEAERFKKEFRPATVESVLEAKRRGAAFAPENDFLPTSPLNVGLEWIRVRAMERLAVELYGSEVAGPAVEYARKTYPMPNYGPSVWGDWLCGGKRTAIAFHLEPDPTPEAPHRIKMVTDAYFPPDAAPRITRAEFERRFALNHRDGLKDAPEPDDGGLFERTIGALGRAAA